VVQRLHRATTEGRLLAEELDERLGSVFAARTYGELDALVADLPATPSHDRRRPNVQSWGRGALAFIVLFGALVGLAGARHAAQFGYYRFGLPPQARTRFFAAGPHAHQHFAALAAAPVILGLFAIIAVCVALAWRCSQDPHATKA
jgi:Domain of unknown function (DUF1707)